MKTIEMKRLILWNFVERKIFMTKKIPVMGVATCIFFYFFRRTFSCFKNRADINNLGIVNST